MDRISRYIETWVIESYFDDTLVRKNLDIPDPCSTFIAIWACLPMFLFHRTFEQLCEGEKRPWFA